MSQGLASIAHINTNNLKENTHHQGWDKDTKLKILLYICIKDSQKDKVILFLKAKGSTSTSIHCTHHQSFERKHSSS